MHRVVVTKHDCSALGVRHAVDCPENEQKIEANDALTSGLVLSGWVAVQSMPIARMWLEFSINGGDIEKIVDIKAAKARQDAEAMLCKHYPSFNVCLGYEQQVEWPTEKANLFVELDGKKLHLATFKTIGALEILRGSNQWLFLNNDANRSVDQFTGDFILSFPLRFLWHKYFWQLTRYLTNTPYCMLIAPSKEMVLRDYYPVAKGKVTPVEQVVSIAKARGASYVYPEALLGKLDHRAFRVTDTHWSLDGARAAWMSTLEKLDVDVAPLEALFANDKYVERGMGGDLGNKLYPPERAQERNLVGISYRKFLTYDNNLPNFGRVMAIEYDKAVYKKRLVIFGSSSSYTMLNFVYRTFSEVVLVHSAANFDNDLVELLSPDYVLLQSNGRFLVRPPTCRYSLVDDIRKKWASLTSEQQQACSDALTPGKISQLPSWLQTLHLSTFEVAIND